MRHLPFSFVAKPLFLDGHQTAQHVRELGELENDPKAAVLSGRLGSPFENISVVSSCAA
jgi:hypothetical protein